MNRTRTRFWTIEAPSANDYRRLEDQGVLEHPVSLPGIDCPSCSDDCGYRRVLVPYRLPPTLERQLRSLDGPVSPKQYRDIRAQLRRSLKNRPSGLVNIAPGCHFAPPIWCRAKPPSHDIFRPSGGLVVSARLRRILKRLAGHDIGFTPVDLRIGRRPNRRRRIEEPEDVLAGLAYRKDNGVHGRWYQVAVFARSHPIPSVRLIRTCRACGGPVRRWPSGPLKIIVRPGMWRGHDIFTMPPTSEIVVTDRIKQAFEDHAITGCTFEPA